MSGDRRPPPPVVLIIRVENGYIVRVQREDEIVLVEYVARDALGAIEIAAQRYHLDVQVLNAP